MEATMRSDLAILAFALLFPALAHTQAPEVLQGARVRVTAPSGLLDRHVTTVMDVRGDSIVLGVAGGSQTVGFADVTALDVSTGRRTRVLRDAGLGLGAGVIVGAIAGALTFEECVPDTFLGCLMAPESRADAAAFGGLVLGAAGLVAGAVVGIFDRADRWESVVPVRAVVAPTRSGGISVMLSHAF
jgi:hypothetical protein